MNADRPRATVLAPAASGSPSIKHPRWKINQLPPRRTGEADTLLVPAAQQILTTFGTQQ